MTVAHAPAPSLAELQRWFASRALPTGIGNRLAVDVGEIEGWLTVPEPAALAERLDVYRGGYPARIAEALHETYPAVAAVLGEPDFADLVERYADTVTLTAYNLNDAGAELPAFVRADLVGAALPFLEDLAHLEWRVTRAFHAHHAPALDPRTLTWTPEQWAGATLRFQPSVAVISSPWPLLELWSAPARARELARDQVHHVLVYRRDATVRCESICSEEAGTLRLLLDAHRLVDAIARIPAERAGAVSEWFGRWISHGMIASAQRPAPPDSP